MGLDTDLPKELKKHAPKFFLRQISGAKILAKIRKMELQSEAIPEKCVFPCLVQPHDAISQRYQSVRSVHHPRCERTDWFFSSVLLFRELF
jgi:hypothetical protein